MDVRLQTKVYDLGTKEGREEFLRDNPWMKEHPFVLSEQSSSKSKG
jgi:hypothetical protein